MALPVNLSLIDDARKDTSHLWLEKSNDPRVERFTREAMDENLRFIGEAGVQATTTKVKKALEDERRIPYITKHGAYFYDWWKDAKNPQGVLRRATLAEYAKLDPNWDVVFDLDEFARREGKEWKMTARHWLEPDGTRIIFRLNLTGGDQANLREFDVESRRFVEDGFNLCEMVRCIGGGDGGQLMWKDKDTLLIASSRVAEDIGAQGYSVVVREWHRGKSYLDASVIFRGAESDCLAGAFQTRNEDGAVMHIYYYAYHDYDAVSYYLAGDGGHTRLPLPKAARCDFNAGYISIYLKADWLIEGRKYVEGSLLVTKVEDVLRLNVDAFVVVFEPTEGRVLLEGSSAWTKDYSIYTRLVDVKQTVELVRLAPSPHPAGELRIHGAFDMISVRGVDSATSNALFADRTSYVAPTTLMFGSPEADFKALKQDPILFSGDDLAVTQHFTPSADGTQVAYFQVSRKGAQGPQATIIEAYGGFGLSMLPAYSVIDGIAWLEKGHTLVMGNVRGGSEYGNAWREAVLGAKQHKRFEDCAAIASDLIRRGVTTACQLGGIGSSGGGLLMGNMITRYPHLFAAIVLHVGVLDLQRMAEYPLGASCTKEFGDPATMWDEIKLHSPYHCLQEGVKYPVTLISSQTHDDRVHPAHSRRMYAKMKDVGAEVYLSERKGAGHTHSGGGADARAETEALHYMFFEKMLVK